MTANTETPSARLLRLAPDDIEQIVTALSELHASREDDPEQQATLDRLCGVLRRDHEPATVLVTDGSEGIDVHYGDRDAQVVVAEYIDRHNAELVEDPANDLLVSDHGHLLWHAEELLTIPVEFRPPGFKALRRPTEADLADHWG